MKTLVLGEVTGKGGFTAIRKALPGFRRDLCIANAEGLSGGFGITKDGAYLLLKSGVDILTGGEKVFYKKDILEFFKDSSRLLRPLNLQSKEVPGHGMKYVDTPCGKAAVINLIGQVDIKSIGSSSPFGTMDWILEKLKTQGVKTIFVVFHAQATGEKQSLYHYLDGKVTAVIGTHTKIMTADATVSENGTAYISDNGRCGSSHSVGGLDPSVEIMKEKTGIPAFSRDCFSRIELQGVEIESDADGKATSINPIKEPVGLSDDELAKITRSDNGKNGSDKEKKDRR